MRLCCCLCRQVHSILACLHCSRVTVTTHTQAWLGCCVYSILFIHLSSHRLFPCLLACLPCWPCLPACLLARLNASLPAGDCFLRVCLFSVGVSLCLLAGRFAGLACWLAGLLACWLARWLVRCLWIDLLAGGLVMKLCRAPGTLTRGHRMKAIPCHRKHRLADSNCSRSFSGWGATPAAKFRPGEWGGLWTWACQG